MTRLGRNWRRERYAAVGITPSLFLDFAHTDPFATSGSVVRALATRTAWCFAESDNTGASLQPIIIPANKPRYFGKRWVASNNTWSDKYANGTAIEERFLRGIYSEISSINLLLNSATVATQNITTTAQTYTISAWGSGTITLSGTATGVLITNSLLHDDRATLTITATAGTLILTVAGNVVLGQFENNPMATSYIPTGGAAIIGNADVLTFPNAGNVSNTAGTVLMDVTPAFDIPNGNQSSYGNNFLIDFGNEKGSIRNHYNQIRRNDGTTTITSPNWVALKSITYKIGSRYGYEGQRNWLNGNAGTNGTFDGDINLGLNMKIGGFGGDNSAQFGGNIKNLKIYKKALSDAKIIELQKTYLIDEAGIQLTDELETALFYY